MIPVINHIPERHIIIVEINGLTDNIYVDETNYNNIKNGDILQCKYTNGRIFNTLYIKSYETY